MLLPFIVGIVQLNIISVPDLLKNRLTVMLLPSSSRETYAHKISLFHHCTYTSNYGLHVLNLAYVLYVMRW
jgi:hypothetical protein